MDLSTPQKFNKRVREKNPSGDENEFTKVRLNDKNEGIGYEREDIFNKEALENPESENKTESSSSLGAPKGPSENEQSLKDTITVECQKLNGKLISIFKQ